jgi:hypothetical protein
MTLRRIVLISFLLLIPFTAHSQQAPIQNPQAVALVSQALAALDGSTQVNDISLTGTATRTAGSDIESGNVTLKALGTSDSRLDLIVSTGTYSDVRSMQTGANPQGFWIVPNGSPTPYATHNCLTDAAWFMPALSVLSQLSSPSLIVLYVGQETKNGVAVQHLHFATQSATSDSADVLQRLTAEEVYLDASTFLPVELTFDTHADDDALTNIPVEVDFSNYQVVNGVQIPFHIQKFVNGSLFLDLAIQNAILNSGLNASIFSSN